MITEPKTNSGSQGEASSQEKQIKKIQEFLNEYSRPQDIKDDLYEMLTSAISSEDVDGAMITRANYMMLHKRMCDLIDAAYEIHRVPNGG